MQIVLGFDEDLLRRYDGRGASLFFRIALEHGGEYYPAEDWWDFGAVIVDWWMLATVRLLQGAPEGKFTFMDGPYVVDVRRMAASRTFELIPEHRDVRWLVPYAEVGRALIKAAQAIVAECERMGVGERDRASLAKGVEALHTAIVANGGR